MYYCIDTIYDYFIIQLFKVLANNKIHFHQT